MRRWSFFVILGLAAGLTALGCGSSASGVAITLSPTVASVITNRTQQFDATITGSSNVAATWALTCASGVAANTCGTINAAGLYTAPPTIPTVTSNGTTTAEPAVTVTATSEADTTKAATATLTIVTGISILITPTTATVGTGEFFQFTASVNNPGCNLTSDPTCANVTWSLPTNLTPANADGTIGASTGIFTAPSTVPSSPNSSTVIVTATSVADTSVTATATVTVETATTPTVTSVSPNTTVLGSLFQDVYITGTNFISTEEVFINGAQLAPTFISNVSTSVLRARIPDIVLAQIPTNGTFQISVAEQSGPQETCTTDASACEITVLGARPGFVGLLPDSVPQGSAGGQSFQVDGGFYGTGANPAAPAVTALFDGQNRSFLLPASQTLYSTRQLKVNLNPSDASTPGLYPVSVQSNVSTGAAVGTGSTQPAEFAVANLAVQPNYTPPTMTTIAVGSSTSSAPNDVAVNPTTGMAVVANTGSNDVSLIDLTVSPPKLLANVCTAGVGAVPPCPAAGPTSVAVDYVRNIALVVNATAQTVVVVDLSTHAVTSVLGVLQNTPEAVGINPVTGRGLVAMQEQNYGVLVDVTQNPTYAGIVSITTGNNPHVAIEPNLNWALATPGGQGTVGIVNLSQQSSNTVTAISRTTNVVTVSVQNSTSPAIPPLSILVGDTVDIQGIQFPVCTSSNQSSCPSGSVSPTVAALAPGFDGFYTVTAVGPQPNQFSYTQTGASLSDVASTAAQQIMDPNATPLVSYSQPAATVGVPVSAQGIAVNPETQQAVMVDPTTGGVVTFLNLLDQTTSPLSLQVNMDTSPDVGTTAVAYNPLTNTIVAVNFFANTLSVIAPPVEEPLGATPLPARRLNDNNLFTTRPGPIAVAIDPGTNIAVIANQTDNSVSVLNLGAIQSFSVTETSPKTIVTTSSLGSAANPQPQSLTVIGKGLTCSGGTTSFHIRLDGAPLATSCQGTGDRELTATIPGAMLGSARRYAVDVADASGTNVTNAEALTVEQSVDVTSGACPIPEPMGVSIDPKLNLAAVALFGCNSLALINLSTGSGTSVTVGSNPIGVAVVPRLHLAVVANNGGAGTASIVDEVQLSVTQTVSTGSGSMGASADEATGEVAIANNVANTVTVVNAATGGTNTISTGQAPVATGFNYVNHQVAVANSGGNTLGVSDGAAGAQTSSFPVTTPTSVVYDPVPTDCGSNNSKTNTTPNTTGCFIVNSSTGNSINIIDPVNSVAQTFAVGINPTSIAYNYRTSTLVTTNTISQTVTVADLLALKVVAVLDLPATAAANSNLALSLSFAGVLEYGLDIHPLTNIAVVADTANGRVLFLPIPH